MRMRFWLAVATVGVIALGVASVHAQAPATSGDAAVAALIAEVRALRTEMAAASRNQLRAQMLLGRVQMQEQRLAYLDKQRLEAANAASMQEQILGPMLAQFGPDARPCEGIPAAQTEQKRDCEGNVTAMRRQFTAQQERQQQLRNQEQELTNALQTEQARWSEFNSRLDELEQSLR